jgi:acyl-coenzyme A synthetase/AMP-(fatty) acid ligase
MWMLPSALYALTRYHDARRKDFASVKACFSGGDKVSGALEVEFTAVAGLTIDECYGMTRSVLRMSTCRIRPKIGSVGKIAPGYRRKRPRGFDRSRRMSLDQVSRQYGWLLRQSGYDRDDYRRRLARYRRCHERRQ